MNWTYQDKYKEPPAITDREFGDSLRLVADTIMRTDGDRDYMNPSDLTVQQTTAVADLLREAATRLTSTLTPEQTAEQAALWDGGSELIRA